MITIRTMIFGGLALAGLLLAEGCGPLRAASASPQAPMEGQLSTTLRQADREVLAARFGVADRLLTDFAEQQPDAPERVEVGFWRALFKLDPANPTATPRDAIALLDAYLASRQVVAHRGAATSLRRIAVALDRPPTVVVASPAPTAPSTRPEARPETRPDTNADEVQRLRDELAKANAELERIKRRLAQPSP